MKTVLSFICIPLTIVSIFIGAPVWVIAALATVPIVAALDIDNKEEGKPMTSILGRFSDIIEANINELLDKAEDPAKMVDQYLRELTDDLAKVKQETAGVMAQETHAHNILEANKIKIAKYEDLAKQALQAGNEDDARVFIAKKQMFERKAEDLEKTDAQAHENAEKMHQMHDKLASDIEKLRTKREEIKAKVAVAKTQENINAIESGSAKAGKVMAAFERMEEKADNMLNKANALEALNKKPTDNITRLEKKYTETGRTTSIDEELANLKQEVFGEC